MMEGGTLLRGSRMSNEPTPESRGLVFSDVEALIDAAQRRAREGEELPIAKPLAYRIALGREVLQLDPVEFRILLLLASRPYHPFTRGRIAAGVTTEDMPVSEETVDTYIASLRQQLRCFRDYVQAVPYIGYRFKA